MKLATSECLLIYNKRNSFSCNARVNLLEVVCGGQQQSGSSFQPEFRFVLPGLSNAMSMKENQNTRGESDLEVEAHDIRRFVSRALAIGIHVARAVVNSFGRLLLGFNELHVYDRHSCQHLETKN